ncbi:hypothetical protein OIU80_03620 [Flavobacterium sp. LS1R47]|uniref:Cytochrome c family protein n=1 Tax=Flavobacterium frigoritolerans TaxID=2987686 RepID=A0A9X3C0B1_9FLAO|nr:hypothetical protein [Flavobacterium frigoritolerans]MCV9931360.1 hypothetical protein [Flavobacterium frigoritolerans]
MKKTAIKIAAVLFTVAIVLFVGCNKKKELAASVSSDGEYLPQDVKQSCTVSESEFNSWFKTGKVSENGLVMPANSVTFPHNNNCDFYKWSEQMFLWITSPASGTYSGKGTVLESAVFYNVSPPDAKGKRTMTQHNPNEILSAVGNINQNGPNRLPLVRDKSGRIFEVEPPKSNEKVKDESNKLVQVSRITTDTKGLLSFIDIKGKVIKNAKPVIESKVDPANVLQEFKVGKKSVFLNSKGEEVQTEQGQAGSHGALMGENKSLVYYITMVNDVYAYFLTGVNEGKLKGNQFPTTASARDSILAYAKTKGWATPPDPDALAMELKTSWIEVKDLPNAASYITIQAKIPTYDKSNPNKWVINGQTTTTLALVGMHVVGSVAGHPEMIWATFEHEKNSPNAAYAYRDVNDKIKQVKADTGTGWLFNANANDTVGAQNIQNMTVDTTNSNIINIKNPAVNSPTARRIMAWGVASNTVPNGEDKTPADSNSEIISINNVVRKMLDVKDIRRNYLLIGATWTFGGSVPNGKSYPYGSATDSIHKGDAIGTGQLANTTMETYFQSPSSASNAGDSRSCFYCHGYTLNPNGLSHVFGSIISLPPYSKKILPK